MADFNLKAIFEFVDKSAAGVKGAEKNIGGLEKATAAAGKALVALGVAGAAKAAYHLAELGAQSIRTKTAFEAISGGAAEAAVRLDAMRDATRGAMSEQAMMAAANKLMQMGLADSASELEQVTTMAVRLGTAMGRDASQAIEEFALLLANQSIPRLDTFGISAGRVRERIAELQAETKGMTREAAFMQATMEIGSEAMGRLGENTEDAALQFERMSAQLQDTKASLGEMLAQGLAPVLNALYELTNVSGEEIELINEARDSALQGAQSYDDYAEAVERNIKVLSNKLYIDEQGNLMLKSMFGLDQILIRENYLLGDSILDVSWYTAGMTAEFRNADAALGGMDAALSKTDIALDGMGKTVFIAGGMIRQTTGELKDAGADLSGLVQPADMASEAYERLTGNVGGLASALGSFDVSARASWGMLSRLAEQGLLTREQVEYLAVQQGIATEEQIRATFVQQGLIDVLAAEPAAITSVNIGLKALDRYTKETTAATEAEADGQDDAAEAHRNAAKAALQLADDMLRAAGAADNETEALERIPDRVDVALYTQGFDQARAAAQAVKRDIDSIPSSKVVRVHVIRAAEIAEAQYQNGTSYARGGVALVGEAGPELVVMPQGAQVIPNNQINNYNYSRGGDTMIVQDTLSMAAIRETRYRQEMRERSRMM